MWMLRFEHVVLSWAMQTEICGAWLRVERLEQVMAHADCGARPDARRGWARRATSLGRRAARARRCRPACARTGRAAACWRPAAHRAPAALASRPAGHPPPAPHSRRRAWTAASAAWVPARRPCRRPPRRPRAPQPVRPLQRMGVGLLIGVRMLSHSGSACLARVPVVRLHAVEAHAASTCTGAGAEPPVVGGEGGCFVTPPHPPGLSQLGLCDRAARGGV